MNCVGRSIWVVVLGVLVAGMVGCGWLADRDRLVIAKIQDRNITRADFNQVLREMRDDERPIITNKGDRLRFLRQYLDQQMKKALAEKLTEEGKINIPREYVAQLFDQQHPEYAQMASIARPEDYQLSKYDLASMRVQREEGIDRMQLEMQSEAAIQYRIQQAVQDKTLVVEPEELAAAYEDRKEELKTFEKVEFVGLRFYGNEIESSARAAQVLQRVQAGEPFESIVEQFRAANPDNVLQATIENNPSLEKFRGFWAQASGAAVGDIIGPVFMPPSQKVNAQTGQPEETIPGAMVVLKVLAITPPTSLTLEQATPQLAGEILYRKMMERLRQEYGIQIFEENVPDEIFKPEDALPM